MSDVRGLPRGSKTLTVVTIVVFLQVLVVAVFGLVGMRNDQEAAERRALERSEADARAALQDLLRVVRQDVAGRLTDAAKVRDGAGILALERGRGQQLIRSVFVLDPSTREVFWVDDVHRLHLSGDARDRLIADAQAREEEARGLEGRKPLEDVERLVHEFPLRSDGRYPKALGDARRLVELVAERRSLPVDASGQVGRASVDERSAVLTALEAVALNANRSDLSQDDLRSFSRKIEDAVTGIVEGLPTDDPLRAEVSEFRRARESLGEFHAALEAALPGDSTKSLRVTTWGSHLVGVAPRESGSLLVANLDLSAAQGIVQDAVDNQALGRLGLEFRVVPLDALDAPQAEPVAILSLSQAGVSLPFQAELHRVRPPTAAGPGPQRVFYWAIIGGAAGGLFFGGIFLARTIRREVRLARLKADFVSNLSHELKTPLTSIAMFTELLREGKITTPADREEAYDVLQHESERLQRIVTRMIDVARREAQAVPYERKVGDLNRPVREAIGRFRRIVTEPGLDLAMDLHPEPLPVLLDEAAMDDAVTNLLSNAWKYRKGERCRIRVRTARAGRKVEVVVTDDGIGIPRQERRKVFEMFYRAEAFLSRSVPGTGLGLALVRTIVRAHGGSVRIETGEGGVGTLFRLRFPRSRQRVASVAPASPSGANPAPVPHAVGSKEVKSTP